MAVRDTRNDLLVAARGLLRADGPAGVTLRGVGDEVGLSRSAAYRHFDSKDALLAAIATDAFGELARAVGAAAGGARTPSSALRSALVAYVRFALADPYRYRVMYEPGLVDHGGDGLRSASRGAFDGLVIAVAAAQGAEPGAPGSGEPAARVAQRLWATVHGAAELAIGGQLADAKGGRDPERLVTDAVSALFP